MIWKLSACFGVTLILFSVVTGIIFIVLYRQSTIKIHLEELRYRANGIAHTYGEYYTNEWFSMIGNDHTYLNFLDEITLADIWIVKQDKELITHENYSYTDISEKCKIMIDKVFAGESVFSEGFSELLNTPTNTVGVPIKDREGIVIGAVLLHSPVNGTDAAVIQGLSVLEVSILAALILAAIVSIILSYLFTKPLKKMKMTALKLAEGDYTAKTGLSLSDEIGQLAQIIDTLSIHLSDVEKEREHMELMRRDFITDISHELRTPVTILRGSLESLRDGVVTEPDEVTLYIEQMISESLYLERLVNDLLELARLQNTDFSIEMAQLNLCDVISDTVRGMRRVAVQKNIAISVNMHDTECWVMGDYVRIRQMLLIVLDNAIKFSNVGQTVYIELSKDKEGRKILSILDTGSGISQEELPYIFQKFQKENSDENLNGTGLGLAIAHQIAQRHNIEITVYSEPNVKTEFLFYFE